MLAKHVHMQLRVGEDLDTHQSANSLPTEAGGGGSILRIFRLRVRILTSDSTEDLLKQQDNKLCRLGFRG